MLRRTFIATVAALFYLSCVSSAQEVPPVSIHSGAARSDAPLEDYSHTLVPITSVGWRGPLVQAEFGTGFCLDPACQFIGTNYHVAVSMKRLRIRDAKVVKRYLATGPDDVGATVNRLADGGELRYTWSRDLAVFELAKPLRGYHALQFSTADLHIGEPVEIYAYPKGVASPFRTLRAFHASFRGEESNGLLVFDYLPNWDRLRPGASGGVVVDSESGKVVGIFCGVAEGEQRVALAVPVKSLADFLNKTQPFLAELLFPLPAQAPSDEQDFYSKYDPQQSGILQRRTDQSDGSNAVRVLRERAQSLAEGMRDFIAVQTYVWGSGSHNVEAADAYEIQVRNSSQKFREYPNGKKWRPTPSIPKGSIAAVTPTNEWSTLPLYIGTKVGVKIREAPPADIDGRRVRIFQYYGSAEDEPCRTRDLIDFVLFSLHRDLDSVPYGEVWTDEDEDIVRMSLHCEDHGFGWGDGQTIVTYGWLTKPGVGPRLVPVSIVYKAELKKKLYWCRGQFVNYREFVSRVRSIP